MKLIHLLSIWTSLLLLPTIITKVTSNHHHHHHINLNSIDSQLIDPTLTCESGWEEEKVDKSNHAKPECIFEAVRTTDLKLNNYRKRCLENLKDQSVPHWLPIELNHYVTFRNYTGQPEDYDTLLHSDCDHLMEAQVLLQYLRPYHINATSLCPKFDSTTPTRSSLVKSILNGPTNLKLIDRGVNQHKGKLFQPHIGNLTDLIRRHQENHYAELMLNYLHLVRPQILNTSLAIHRILIEFDPTLNQPTSLHHLTLDRFQTAVTALQNIIRTPPPLVVGV